MGSSAASASRPAKVLAGRRCRRRWLSRPHIQAGRRDGIRQPRGFTVDMKPAIGLRATMHISAKQFHAPARRRRGFYAAIGRSFAMLADWPCQLMPLSVSAHRGGVLRSM